jgi:NADH dehydrogenase
LLALERAETEADPERRKALLTFVIIGAGPTGVEMAGAIAELARRTVSDDFRSITPHCSRVMLVEAGDRVLPTFPKILSEAAMRSLADLGVEVLTDAPVRDLGSGYVLCQSRLIFTDTVVWAAGVKASPAAEWLDAEHDTNGRVFVERDLRVPRHDRIFAIGDTANSASPGNRALPAVAPVAKQQGHYVADLILGRAEGAFAYRDFGNLATIGRSRAVIDWRQLQLSGFPAWLIWSLTHIWFLIGFRSRIAVMTSWLWSYLTYQRSARLITGEASSAAQQPPRPITLERKCA